MANEEQYAKVRDIEKRLVDALGAEGLTVSTGGYNNRYVDVDGHHVRFSTLFGGSDMFGRYKADSFHVAVDGTWLDESMRTLPRRVFYGNTETPDKTIANAVRFIKNRVAKIESLAAELRERKELERKRLREFDRAEAAVRRQGWSLGRHGGSFESGGELWWSVDVRVPISEAPEMLELLESHGFIPKREA